MKNSSESLDMLVDKSKQVVGAMDRALNGAEKQLVLEVGNHATKMVEYVVKKNAVQVVNGFVINTPINAIEDDRIIDVEALANILSQSVKQAKIKTKEFTVSIVSKDIIIREMDIPKMHDKDLKNFVQINSRDIFPVNLSNYILGYNIIEKGEKNRIMIAAIPKSIISPYIELGEKLGLTLRGINYSGYELYNYLNFEIGKKSEVYLAVDLGAKNTNAIVISNGVLKFNKIIPKGFGETTQYICEELNCTLVKAEQLKRQYNLIEIPEGQEVSNEEAIITKYTKRAIDNVIQDINRIIEFYNSNNPKNKIDKIYIIGMVSKLKDAEEYFYKKLNIKTKVVKILQKIDFNKKSIHLKPRQLNFINCLGAANLQDRKFIFLKDDLKIQNRSFITTPKFHKLMACLIFVVIFYMTTIVLSTNELKEKVDMYNKFIDSKSAIVKLQDEIKAKNTELQDNIKLASGIVSGAESTMDIIKLLENSIEEMPNGSIINIVRYKYGEKELEIRCSLPFGVDSNTLEGLEYYNLPHDLADKLIKKGCSVEVTPSENIFDLKFIL